MTFEYIRTFICDNALLDIMFKNIWICMCDDAVLDMMFEYIRTFICDNIIMSYVIMHFDSLNVVCDDPFLDPRCEETLNPVCGGPIWIRCMRIF